MRSADVILQEGIRAGQIGGNSEPHGKHAMGFTRFLDDSAEFVGKCADIGSGVGLPGLILADACPATSWLLIERREGRTDLLRRAIARLELEDRVDVFTGDAVEVARGQDRGSFDWVTARSFGPPADTAECSVGLLAPGGSLITSEPYEGSREQRWPEAGLAEVGLRFAQVWETPHGRYLRFVRDSQELTHLPRAGARKRPLF